MKFAGRTVLALLALTCALPTETFAKSAKLVADCVSPADSVTRTPTDEMGNWLAKFSSAWNEDDDYSISAYGALGRVFSSDGRLIHPREMATAIQTSASFAGKKRKEVWLGASDSLAGGDKSYAEQLSRLLKVKVHGCEADAFFMKKGAMLCGWNPVYVTSSSDSIGRSMPAGFKLGDSDFMMLFCPSQASASIDPRSMLSAAAVFGLYPDELTDLTAKAQTDGSASFRLYQYYWIAKRDREKAIGWLEKSADQGFAVARYNIAYELFESGLPENADLAVRLSQQLAGQGFPGPDLRQYYGATTAEQ